MDRSLVVTFEFYVGQPVEVVELEAPGVVLSQWASDRAHRYQVAWWINGERKEDYLFGHELRSIGDEESNG